MTYPVPRNTKQAAPADGPVYPRTSVAIDTTAAAGRAGLTVGTRVRIAGTGLYVGETAVVERLTGNVIPSALVRTADGRARQVRTIDLEPLPPES